MNATQVRAVPEKAFAEAVAVLGRTGSGKSYAARGQVEQLLSRGERVCVIDPTSVWWGLRASSDGKSAGFPVAVFGGTHADVPMVEASAEPLAKLIASRNLPCVIDISEMTRGEQNRFLTHFLDVLYRANRQPLTIVFDEADLYCAQRPLPDQQVLLNRMEQIVRRGRVRGFRPWMITQRPAELHKSVLSQASTLVAMRLTAPQDRDAVGAWIDGQADRAEGKVLLATLPKLSTGEGFVWCPAIDFLERIKFPRITTYDTGQTPAHGESVPAPSVLAEVDLSGVMEALALKQPEKSVTKASKAELASEYNRGFEAGFKSGLDAAAKQLAENVDPIVKQIMDLSGGLANFKLRAGIVSPEVETVGPQPPTVAPTLSSLRGFARSATWPKAERLILTALAQYHPKGRTKNQVAMLAGYSAGGGGFNNSLSALRVKGWISGNGGTIFATDAGIEALGPFDPLPTGTALMQHWCERLGKAEREILAALYMAYPKGLTKEQVAQKTPSKYESSGGGFNNALSRLRTLELITGRGELRASEDFFQ